MAEPRLRVGIDANVLVAGSQLPRTAYEVLRAAIEGHFQVVIPEQVVRETLRHSASQHDRAVLDQFFAGSRHEACAMPSSEWIAQNRDLVRDETDVPIVLALLDANVDIFVTGDLDFNEPDATAHRFRDHVRVLTPRAFLREVMGWSTDAIDAIRLRRWEDLPPEESR